MRAKLMELVYAARVHADEECDKQEGCSRCPYDAQADMCQNGPIVDHLLANGVVVREKGEWVDRYGGKYANPVYDCSKCGKSAPRKNSMDALGNWHVVQDLADFCPNCGADMRGAVNDG